MSAQETITITLKVWRQKGPQDHGNFETINVDKVETHSSFLEMLDFLNEKLILEDKDPIEFDNDCREGICGTCGAVVNGIPHGHRKAMTLCELHMREFNDGDTIVVEPFRSRAFKVIKDLMVDRSALDKIIQAGGYISVNTGGAPDANAIPVARKKPRRPWMQPPASAAVPVWRPVRMPRPCCLLVPRFPSLPCCPRADRRRVSVWRLCSRKWTTAVSVTVPITVCVRPHAPKKSRSPISPALIGSF